MVKNRYLLARKLSNTLPAPLDDLWPTLQHHEMVDPLVCSENKQFHQALESEGIKKTKKKQQTLNQKPTAIGERWLPTLSKQ